MKKITAALILIANCFLPTLAYSQDGSPDNTFGTNGMVTTDIGGSYDFGYSVAIQTDGKIVVAGCWAIVRYNGNGSLDSTFGTGGKVTTPIGIGGKSVAIQTDGKIVLAGDSNGGSSADFGLVRYNSNGSLDNTFGTNGIVTTAIENAGDFGNSVAIQTDGKIVVAGYSYDLSSNYYFALVRYASNGSLDNTFGTGGKVTTDIGGDSYGKSVAIQTDGKILVAGYYSPTGGYTDFALVRYTNNGSLDNTFGTAGKVTTSIGSYSDIGESVVIQTDGKILVSGEYNSNGSDFNFALVCYSSNGTLDNTFGTGGKVTTALGNAFGNTNDYGKSVAIQTDGKIVVAGYSPQYFSGIDFALVRYNSNGSLDNAFGTSGKVTTNIIGSENDYGESVTIQTDGKILVAGYSGSTSSNTNFSLVRYNNNTITGIEEATNEKLKIEVSPNPFIFHTTITFTKEQKNTTIKIMDILGKQIKIINFSGKQMIIEKGEMQKGIYFVQVIDENKNVVNNKIIVQ